MDLSDLILANRGPLADPLIAAAGTDVSHWFSLAPPQPSEDGTRKARPGTGGKVGVVHILRIYTGLRVEDWSRGAVHSVVWR